jgi:predicted  nucleic acid-binding Zn-ribbon protein
MSTVVEPFICLRCGHQYRAEYTKGITVERSCPKCGSNSVRPVPRETPERGGTAGDD